MFSSATQQRRVTISLSARWLLKDLDYVLDTCITHPNISDEFDNWHCRPIQNGRRRPFCKKKSKKKEVAYRSEMARNAIKRYLRTSKMADAAILSKILIKFRINLKWPEMPSKVNFGHTKWPINLKWPEMRSKVISWFSDIQNGRRKNKFCIDLKWPELRSKVNLGNPKWQIDLKWPEKRSKVNFGHPKWVPAAIL